MKLKQLTIQNFRGFKQFDGTFNAGINVLVGLNGYGKTSLLDAISVGYGQFFSAMGTGVDRGISDQEIHLAKHRDSSEDGDFNMEHQFPVTIACHAFPSYLDDFPIQWERSRNTLKGRTTQVKSLKDVAKRLQSDVQDNVTVDLPVFGYYGTGRLWKQKQLSALKEESLSSSSRLEGYRDCMDPESSYAAFAKWLRQETIAELERKLREIEKSGFPDDSLIREPSVREQRLGAISQAVNVMLAPSGWSNMRYSASETEVVATHPEQGNVAVSKLSDGVRNMIGLVADIAYRCVRLNSHLGGEAVTKTHGLVLIDEVDMHLHPQWQQLVLQNLLEAFPNIQFIVTSHSPQVLTTVKKESVHLIHLEDGKCWTQNPIGETYGIASQDALLELMQVEPRPPLERVLKLKAYMNLIDLGQHTSDEGESLRGELEALYGKGHEELNRADRKIRRKGL